MSYIKRLFSNGFTRYEWDGIHTPAVNSNENFEANLLKEIIGTEQCEPYKFEYTSPTQPALIAVLERIADALEELAY